MDDSKITDCLLKIAEEEARACAAASPEAAELHVQKVRLYRIRLAILRGDRWDGGRVETCVRPAVAGEDRRDRSRQA